MKIVFITNLTHNLASTISTHDSELQWTAIVIIAFAVSFLLFLHLPKLRRIRAKENKREAAHEMWADEYQTHVKH